MTMSNKVYDILKWIAMYLLPGLVPCTLHWLVFGISRMASRLSVLLPQLTLSLVLFSALARRLTRRQKWVNAYI